jgi:hypothetical protein
MPPRQSQPQSQPRSQPQTPPAPEPLPPPPAPADTRTLTGRTHNGLMPTGELVPAEHSEVALHNFIYMTGALGLTDRLELDVSAPVVPLFGQAGLRLALTPRSAPLKLVVGVNAWVSLLHESTGSAVYSGTVTVAYQSERTNLHGTLMFFSDLKSDDAVGVTSVGASYRATPTVAAFVEVSQVIAGTPREAGRFYTSSAGLKFLGETTDVDAGILLLSLPDSSDDLSIPLPFVSVTRRF